MQYVFHTNGELNTHMYNTKLIESN